MSERTSQIEQFLTEAGWDIASRDPVPGDASTRAYQRLDRAGERAILMDAPPGLEAPNEPEGATESERRALGYNAVARLAGPDPAAFACIAHALRQRGFSAPKILAADLDHGLLLLEDFGADVYAPVIAQTPAVEAPLYEAAVETLGEIYRSSIPAQLTYNDATWRIRKYDDIALIAETNLLLDWYVPDAGIEVTDGMREDLHGLLGETFVHLDAHAPGLALRDFHAENLFWLPDRKSVARVGLIDFQDGLFVHPAYDLMSLITDIRRDVSPGAKEPLTARFMDAAKLSDRAGFDAAYAVLSVQRGLKLLGFPVRADVRDGKPQYRALLPRVKRHLAEDLAHPAVASVRKWLTQVLPGELS